MLHYKQQDVPGREAALSIAIKHFLKFGKLVTILAFSSRFYEANTDDLKKRTHEYSRPEPNQSFLFGKGAKILGNVHA